ncbi:MAG: hypothetical protein N0E59_02250 [Candidatus Thiodiazotropha taylori]|nr:hypothetical protein [Candidatus Thiodiazotropha taylori]MCG8051923.1 hypothetical protein [Candidatus Thiodiazotropha taylori]MCG8109561.1 hypothetical protein [Candidatus Thiodiazotropha taylori]MCW4281905.1 hypothetical protein [Candidatus Thiodiazotropha taylori]MCW4306091.1 hypothetical protein [Candidatus Thiodiazotropha taylori]
MRKRRTLRFGRAGEHGVLRDIDPMHGVLNHWTWSEQAAFRGGHVVPGDTLKPYARFMAIKAASVVPFWPHLGQFPDLLVMADDGIYHVSQGVVRVAHAYEASEVGGHVRGLVYRGVPMIHHAVMGLMYWDIEGALLRPMPGLEGFRAGLIRPFKSYLIAIGYQGNPYRVAWSDAAVLGGIPQDWRFMGLDSQAGVNHLWEGDDPIVDARALNDTCFIYKQNSTWSMSLTGDALVFAFRKRFAFGALNDRSVACFENAHYVMTRDDIMVHEGERARSLLKGRLKRWLSENVDVSPARMKEHMIAADDGSVLACYPANQSWREAGFKTIGLSYRPGDKTFGVFTSRSPITWIDSSYWPNLSKAQCLLIRNGELFTREAGAAQAFTLRREDLFLSEPGTPCRLKVLRLHTRGDADIHLSLKPRRSERLCGEGAARGVQYGLKANRFNPASLSIEISALSFDLVLKFSNVSEDFALVDIDFIVQTYH